MRPLLLMFCLLFVSCGNLENLANKAARSRQQAREMKKLAEAAATGTSVVHGESAVGEVVDVHADLGYALIRTRNGDQLKATQELECRGTGSARLRVTPERLKTFYAADILSGVPQKGDSVVPVRSNVKAAPKLVLANALPGSSAPGNTIAVDPSTVRAEDLPQTNLESIPLPTPSKRPATPRADTKDAGNLLLAPPPRPDQPPLPQ